MTYAWFMVGITFLTQAVAMGITFYSATFFLVPLQQEFGTGATEVALIGTVMSIGGAVVAPFVGRWVARGSIRNIMTLGCLAMGIGFLVGSRATEIWHLIALFASFVTFAMATMGGVTTQALVVNWFEENRAMALGISLMGISASGFILPPITTALVEAGGWRGAYEVFGWACLCVMPIVYLTVVGRPEERSADAPELSVRVGERVDPPGFSARAALRERNLWIIAITCGLSFMATSAVMLHIVPHAMQSGIDPSHGAYIIQAIAAGAMLAKVGFGWLARRIGDLRALQLALAMQAFGTFGLNFVDAIAPLIGIASVLGTGLGGVMPLGAALLARAFGPAVFGPMMGLMTPIMIPFQSIGQPIAGAVVDFSGSYRPAWFGFTVVMGAAMAILAALRLPDDAPSGRD